MMLNRIQSDFDIERKIEANAYINIRDIHPSIMQAIQEFASTEAKDFEIIKDGIDQDINIIRHIPTGFLNITKLSSHVLRGNSSDWFMLESTKRMIEACKTIVGIDKVFYVLDNGTPEEFTGTYLHEFLYDHFIMWSNEDYAMKVSFGIKQKEIDGL